jgi:hypothetical protein
VARKQTASAGDKVTPVHYLFRPDDDAMVAHFRAMAEATAQPWPSTVGVWRQRDDPRSLLTFADVHDEAPSFPRKRESISFPAKWDPAFAGMTIESCA